MGRGRLGLLATIALLAVPALARAGDDTDLFSTVSVPPNVLLLVDNSQSMNNLVWHPDFDPSKPTACNYHKSDLRISKDTTYTATGSGCNNSKRTMYHDPAVDVTWVDHRYANWLHSLPDGDPRLAEIAQLNNGTYSECLQEEGYTTFSKYRRSRVTAARQVLREVICNVNKQGKVRFGIAWFRSSGGGSGDPDGGYVRVPINDYDAPAYTLNGVKRTHGQHLEDAIKAFEGETVTPLGESLFHAYLYFMSRNTAHLPLGADGKTKFPVYKYRTTDNGPPTNVASEVPPSPVQYPCQKNYVVIITDGEPTKDDFDPSASETSNGFKDFDKLIGDYNPDGEIEKVDDAWTCGGPDIAGFKEQCALYLDDIAMFMAKNDMRPDLEGKQNVEVYTIGFSTAKVANDLLQKTAEVGGGKFETSNNAEELAAAITRHVTSIINKSQSFTAATVPATRTADGGNLYTSLFKPKPEDAFWEGHLKLFQITSAGDILDKNGNCALEDPKPEGECKSGAIKNDAVPFWDAAAEMPDPDARKLYTTVSGSWTPFTKNALSAAALGDPDPSATADDLTLADLALYPGSGASTVNQLKDAIIQNVRGCRMGTGVSNGCVRREWILGDIFHSNPLVVGRPRSFINEPSYRQFASAYAGRWTVVYAGANDGFLHAFYSGDPDPSTAPNTSRDEGEEMFGFMPWPARRNIRYLPIDTGGRDYYFVDGSPVAADVWFYENGTDTEKKASEWRTILAGGLRQGGRAYYALDVTDPSDPSYPEYLWEFPAETASADLHAAIGETWGQPVITRVRVKMGQGVYERWVAVVSGGYHPSGDPNDPAYDPNAVTGRGVYLIDVTNGRILGQKTFDPGATDGRQEMRYAMPSTPSVFDLDSDGYADVIYIGDLGGNVWKWVIKYDPAFDNFLVDPINGSGSELQPDTKFRKWFSAKANAAAPLGVTVGGATYYKSIFYSPSGAFALNRFWLAFGTGERANLLRKGNPSVTTENNRFYVVKDLDPLDRRETLIPTLTEADLVDRTSSATCPNLASVSGYFFRVDDDEKFVTDTEIFSYWVIASSFTPGEAPDACTAGGSAHLYIFKLFCGQGFFFDSSTHSPGADDLPGGGPGGSGGLDDPSLPDYGDPASRRIQLDTGMPTDPRISVSPDGTRVIVTQQEGEIENLEGPLGTGSAPGQVYWREIVQ